MQVLSALGVDAYYSAAAAASHSRRLPLRRQGHENYSICIHVFRSWYQMSGSIRLPGLVEVANQLMCDLRACSGCDSKNQQNLTVEHHPISSIGVNHCTAQSTPKPRNQNIICTMSRQYILIEQSESTKGRGPAKPISIQH